VSAHQKIQLGHSEMFVREDNIIQIDALGEHSFTRNDLENIHAAILKLKKTEKAKLLLVASSFTNMDMDALKFISRQETSNYIQAKAFVIKSLAQRLLITFVINVKGTSVPTKFFTKQDEAIAWLHKQ
jgi:hypothetical protein